MRIVLFTCMMICVVYHGAGQTLSYGIFGQYIRSMHTANFISLPGIPNCCPRFETGTGNGVAGGVLYEISVGAEVYIQPRLSYVPMSAVLSTKEATRILVNGIATNGEFTHFVDASLAALSFEPSVGYLLTKSLRLQAGVGLGFLVSSSFSQREQITLPSNAGTFLDSSGASSGRRTRNEFSGPIPDVQKIQASVFALVSYKLSLNTSGTMFMVPEVGYWFGVTPFSNSASWSGNALRAGVALVYSPQSEPKYRALPVERDSSRTIAIHEVPPLTDTLAAIELTEESIDRANITLSYSPDKFNLVSMRDTTVILFSDIDFSSDSLSDDAKDILVDLALSINNAPARIRLEIGAHTDNVGDSTKNLALSRKWAKLVVDFLVVHAIDPKRLTYVGYGDSQPVAPNTTTHGRSENRRVQFRLIK